MNAYARGFAVVGSLLTFGLAQRVAAQDWYNQPEGAPPPVEYGSPETRVEAADGRPVSDGSGLGIGLKLGYGIPQGDAAERVPFDDFTRGAVLTEFSLNYGITPSIIVGGYAGLGFGLIPDDFKMYCRDDVECSEFFLNFGLHAEYRFLPGAIVNPWLGANVGLEWAYLSVESGPVSASTSFFGVAFGPTAGVDFELNRWGLGPFVSYQAGRYLTSNAELNLDLDDDYDSRDRTSGSIDEKAFHGWLTFGVRARYTFAH